MALNLSQANKYSSRITFYAGRLNDIIDINNVISIYAMFDMIKHSWQHKQFKREGQKDLLLTWSPIQYRRIIAHWLKLIAD
ncbi:hypothetical protein GTU79_06755 [Sodalis ligni]|uniref:hypothetical protein n=1 Tax=Sodalis ligni TaxID=2697027 RepID=UPI001BDDDBCB|nr:hypothetical protein [Sodalis ligni]QWA12435.1 hypothetical protein GTU79_06755 [Sodalis ligni]